ncbi:MAG: hypothetical protein HY718_06415 [Planctomycetes bacterium]|nr:hypothetical protein [Planctomycetota bacterium]
MAVSLVEAIVFRVALGAWIRRAYWRILAANAVSTLTGGIVLAFQDAIIDASGIRRSVPDFVRGYVWVSLVLISLYWAKSVLVEGFIVSTRRFAEQFATTRRRLFRTVVLANLASYLFTGPLFYLVTRPTFGHLQLSKETSWTVNPDVPVYYIDAQDHFVKRITVAGQDRQTVIPYPVTGYIICGRADAYVYRGTDQYLYVLRSLNFTPIRVTNTSERFYMPSVGLSPDQRRLAFVQPSNTDEYPNTWRLRVADLDNGRIDDAPNLTIETWNPVVAWSADGKQILVSNGDTKVVAIQAAPPWPSSEQERHPPISSLAESYTHGSKEALNRGFYNQFMEDTQREYRVEDYPYLGSRVWVRRRDQTVLTVTNDYGFLKLGWPTAHSPSFLPKGAEFLLEELGGVYLVGIDQRRMSLLVRGGGYAMLTPRFRVGFSTAMASTGPASDPGP